MPNHIISGWTDQSDTIRREWHKETLVLQQYFKRWTSLRMVLKLEIFCYQQIWVLLWDCWVFSDLCHTVACVLHQCPPSVCVRGCVRRSVSCVNAKRCRDQSWSKPISRLSAQHSPPSFSFLYPSTALGLLLCWFLWRSFRDITTL